MKLKFILLSMALATPLGSETLDAELAEVRLLCSKEFPNQNSCETKQSLGLVLFRTLQLDHEADLLAVPLRRCELLYRPDWDRAFRCAEEQEAALKRLISVRRQMPDTRASDIKMIDCIVPDKGDLVPAHICLVEAEISASAP